MIDVFMLVAAGLLRIDKDSDSIQGVQFCECESDDYTVIREMIGSEDAGFFGILQDVALFKDDSFTTDYADDDAISVALEDEALADDKVERLQLKRTFMHLRSSFPYDYINLDFCDYYYPNPPNVFTINETVQHFLEWQWSSPVGDGVLLDDFVLAVTCRHDSKFSREAEKALSQLVEDNCSASTDYAKQVQESRKVTKIEEWIKKDREDFFLAAWPKDIARMANALGWKTDILDYVYYQRPADGSVPYIMICLVIKFSRAATKPDYLPAALHALNRERRQKIEEIDPQSSNGKQIHASLEKIVVLRNERARRIRRLELPPLGQAAVNDGIT